LPSLKGRGKKNTLVSKKSQIQPANVTVPGERKKKEKQKKPHTICLCLISAITYMALQFFTHETSVLVICVFE